MINLSFLKQFVISKYVALFALSAEQKSTSFLFFLPQVFNLYPPKKRKPQPDKDTITNYLVTKTILDVVQGVISTETEEGIAHAIVKGTIDFNRYPWPRVFDKAKDLVKGMLDANPYNKFTVEEVIGNLDLLYLAGLK
ncbi:hypothetical protein FXO37_35987 [Capsicum annuum]|nr:hypothetical protein FXO37_35987 [Capsicum annuum]